MSYFILVSFFYLLTGIGYALRRGRNRRVEFGLYNKVSRAVLGRVRQQTTYTVLILSKKVYRRLSRRD